MKRTPATELDEDFEYVGEIVKSYVDETTGERYIVGAASGLEEDRDGERVSKNCIAGMVKGVTRGDVKLVAGSHAQNWLTEIGDATEAHTDPKTDQMMVKTKLPPEGVDPIADKAWRETHRRKMGFSIGGKLRSAYHELTEVGKKRKVLDAIELRHLCLTDKPAYAHSFAHAVAKTYDGPEPAEEQFEDAEPEVEKNLTTGSWVSGGGTNSGADSKGAGQRNAGVRNAKTGKPSVDEEKSSENEDDDDDEPLQEADRHLACPNCGHEFAAELPVDMTPGERAAADKKPDTDSEKSTEADMDLMKTVTDLEARVETLEDPEIAKEHVGFDEMVERLKKKGHSEEKAKAIAGSIGEKKYGKKGMEDKSEEGREKKDDAKKTFFPDDATPEGTVTVAKTEADTPDVLKMLAASHSASEERFEKIEKSLGEALSLIGENLKGLTDRVNQIPIGRKSVARVRAKGDMAASDIGKTNGDDRSSDDDGSLHSALKAANEATYGIH